MKNDWRENYVRSIKKVNEVLKNQMTSSEQIIQSPRFSTKIETSQINSERNGSPFNKNFRRRRVATAIDKTIDLSNLTVLENLHKRMNSMLRLKKALNFTTDKQQCEQNSRFLNSFLEDNNKKFCVVSTVIGKDRKFTTTNKAKGLIRAKQSPEPLIPAKQKIRRTNLLHITTPLTSTIESAFEFSQLIIRKRLTYNTNNNHY